MKHEWRKKEKENYMPKAKPEVREIENMKFIQIKGKGNPNGEDFAKRVGTLYSLSYAIKMMPKKGIIPQGYFEYVVYPLEGIWDLQEDARGQEIIDKDKLIYTIMIRQPEFVTGEVFKTALAQVKQKKPDVLLEEVEFVDIEEGMCVQMMHIGPFEEEKKTFDIMEEFCQSNNLHIKSKAHREIYISDIRKTAPEKLKTVLRYRIKNK